MASERIEPPEGSAPDWTISQDRDRYTDAEHATWDRLFARQALMLRGRVTPTSMQGLDILHLAKLGIPDFDDLNERLHRATGWRVITALAPVPDALFFNHLAQRRFVAARSILAPDRLEYLPEPDIFQDVFGHVPLLANPAFADYMQAFGEAGRRALDLGALDYLARLYWYTAEFGLIADVGGLKLYGAGLVTSASEGRFALEDASPNRIGFDLARILRTRYRIDDFQQSYFVIESFEALRKRTGQIDLAGLYEDVAQLPALASGAIAVGDRLLHRGTQDYARGRGPQGI